MHHLRRVLRVQEGEPLEILDLDSPNLIRAKIESLKERELLVSLEEFVERPPPPKIRIALGLMAPQTFELIIEKLTELEVSEVLVFLAKNSQLQLEQLEKRFERLERIRDSARIQSSSRSHLRLSCYDSLEFLLTRSEGPRLTNSNLKENSLKLLASLAPQTPNILELLKKTDNLETSVKSADAIVIVGPEGGLRQEEEALAKEHGFVGVSLGLSTLRTETAALAAASILRVALPT